MLKYAFNPVKALNNPEVRKYFLSLFESNVSSECKYSKLIEFFESQDKILLQLEKYEDKLLHSNSNEINKIISFASQETQFWNPGKILQHIKESIERAVRRLKYSQHQDGGWGYEVEVSKAWGTAYALLCINSAKSEQLVVDFDDHNFARGVVWLWRYLQDWRDSMPIYDVSLVLTCLDRISQKDFNVIHRYIKDYVQKSGDAEFIFQEVFENPSIINSVMDQSIDKIIRSQNDDGGWGVTIWVPNYEGRGWSDVGATSCVIKMLAEANVDSFSEVIKRALNWLINTQNLSSEMEGSWNNVHGQPDINKTCDALSALLLGERYSVDTNQSIHRGVGWIIAQETFFLERENIVGRGWAEGTDKLLNLKDNPKKLLSLENTCLTLETLTQLQDERISLTLLADNAQWLMRYQQSGENVEDGKWLFELTSRIGFALGQFYKRIKNEPLFETLD